MKPRIYNPTEKDFSHNGLGVLSDASRADIREAANGVYELEVEHPLKSRFKEYFENGYQIKVKPNDQEDYHVFEIKRTYEDTNGNNVLIYAQSRTYKLGNREVQHVEINSQNGSGAMKLITAGMDQSSDIELFSDIQTVSSTVFEARNVLNCIAGEQGSLLQYWGGEIKREPFRLSLLRRRGRDKLGTVRYGKDLQGLKITFDWQSIITRCLPYADLQDSEDGQTKRIYGKKIDSDLVKNYPDVYAKHIQFTEEQGVKDQASLDKAAAKYFISVNPGCDKPKVSIEVEFEKLTDSEEAKEFSKLRNYGLFDTFSVYHKLYDIHVEAKITEVLYDGLNEKVKKISAGDTQIAFYTQQNYEFQETIKTLTKKGYMSDFLDYVTNLINGVEGGSVLQYPKNKPHSTYYLDTDSRDTAKDVVVLNNQGIGFSRTGWRGPFVNAWGINGDLNADFIRVGKIRANIFETSFNNVGDQLKLSGGALQAVNNNKKLMELTKNGNEFWGRDGKNIGVMGIVTEDNNPLKGYAITDPYNNMLIRTYKKDIIFATDNNHGMFLRRDGRLLLYDGTDVYAPEGGNAANFYGNVEFSRDVNIKGKLTINGQEVFPGQGGGGNNNGGSWNGMYPPEVTSQADKFAWELWIILLSKGYSKAAAAGILGNVQGEAGVSMNPDIAQIGGPAYGIVQWDGSAYPLVPPATYDGRTYVQNLMRVAGITEDYKTMTAQGNLLDWTMYNGQWLGIVQPTSVSGFKSMSDPRAAAHTFEKNYERPANAHPERQGWALAWYNKFKDLQIPSAGNVLSTAKSLIGYFHYSQPMRWNFGSVENPDRNGYADCSSFVWLVLTKAGYRTAPRGTLWYTGSMTADARGAKQYLTEVSPNDAKAGDIIIVNLGAGAGNDGHTAVLAEDWHGYTTVVVEMGGMQSGGAGVGRVDLSFGYLLNGGDVCLARAKK